MGRMRADLAAQRVTLSTQAVRIGVIELDGDSARLLVFLDQLSHRGKGRTTSAAAQLTVTARWEDDQWRIVDMKPR
jgi:Mce-associated membrane protein